MPTILADRVQETTTTTGTGTLTLNGPTAQNQSFVSGIGDTNTTYYGLLDANGIDWEVGRGVVSSTGPTLTRATVFASTNSNSQISLSAGSHTVFCDVAATLASILLTAIVAAGSNLTISSPGTLAFQNNPTITNTGTNPSIINSNSAIPTAIPSGTILELVVGPAQNGGMTVDGYGGVVNIIGRRADGSIGSPSAVQSGETIVTFIGMGYGASAYGGARAKMAMAAAENWSNTAQGTYITWLVSLNGGTVSAEAMRLQNTGILTIGTTAATGTNKLQVIGGVSTDNLKVTGTIDTSFPLGNGIALNTGLVTVDQNVTLTGTAGGTLSINPGQAVRDVIANMPASGGTVTLSYAGTYAYQATRVHIKQGATASVVILNSGTVAGYVFGTSGGPTSFTVTPTANVTDMLGILGVTTAYARVMSLAQGFTA